MQRQEQSVIPLRLTLEEACYVWTQFAPIKTDRYNASLFSPLDHATIASKPTLQQCKSHKTQKTSPHLFQCKPGIDGTDAASAEDLAHRVRRSESNRASGSSGVPRWRREREGLVRLGLCLRMGLIKLTLGFILLYR